MSLPEGTVTFLRSDIEGSMDLVWALGARYHLLNAEHQALVRDCIVEQDGDIVRTEGDAFFVVFTDAGRAARAAVAIQRAMAAYAWPDGFPFKLRIGLHTGSAVRAGDDYGGFEVNRAARIAALGAGGQIILSDAARALVAADLPRDWTVRDLGRHRLKGVVDPEPIFQLDSPGLPSEFPALRGREVSTEHLPVRLSSFIGREDELERLSGLLRETRILTLTGPGGTGKTTLALELARRRADDFADGAWFIDLQAVTDPDQVEAEIAHGLGLFDGAVGPAAERLAEFMADREALILIDNFEQVVEAADVVNELLRASPATRFIVTSRISLKLAAEQEFAVHPLELGATDGGGEAEAVRLFVERVRRVRPTETFGEAEMDTVRDTCRMLDGLPLAIELTAARASTLPLHLIRDRLAQRLPLPGSGPRDLPKRQQTIEDTVAWSYDLLDPPLQHLSRRLAVFVESFDLEQAEPVCGAASELGVDILDGLSALAEHNLIHRVDDEVGGVRFGMLETIRAHTLGRLRDSGEEATMRERHATAFAELAERVAAQLPGPDQRHWLDRLDPDDPNMRAAAVWAIETGDLELAVGCAARPWRFWLLTGRLAEGTDLIRLALSLDGAQAATAARLTALDAAGSVAYWSGDLEQARYSYEEELALAEDLADEPGRAKALMNLGFVLALLGEAAPGKKARREATRIFELQGDTMSVLMIEWAETLDPTNWADATLQAAAANELAARLEALGTSWHSAMAMATRALAAYVTGELLEAGTLVVRGLRMARDTREFGPASFGVEPFTTLFSEVGDPEAAAITYGALKRIWLRYGIRSTRAFWQITGAPDPLVAMTSALGPDRLEAAIAQGQALSEGALIDFLETSIERAGTLRTG